MNIRLNLVSRCRNVVGFGKTMPYRATSSSASKSRVLAWAVATSHALAAFSMIAVGLATERMAGSKMDPIACEGKDFHLASSVSYRRLMHRRRPIGVAGSRQAGLSPPSLSYTHCLSALA